MELLSAFLLAPLALVMFLFTAGWWILLVFTIAIGMSTYDIYDNKSDKFEYSTFIIFVCVIFSAVFFAHWIGGDEEVGILSALGMSLKDVFSGIGYYAIWGIICLPFLWFFEQRRFARRYDKASQFFKKTDSSVSEDEKSTAWKEALQTAGLRRDQKILAKSKEGVSRIASFFFMWPLHIIDKALGELLREIPHLIASLFGKPLDSIGDIATGGDKRSGQPEL